MEEYYHFKRNERAFVENEFAKAYRDVVARLTKELSSRLHFLKEYSDVLKAKVNGEKPDRERYMEAYSIVKDCYNEYLEKSVAYFRRVAERLEDRITTVLSFEYQNHNYRVDPYDNCIRSADYYYWRLMDHVREEQKDKDLILVAYDYMQMMRFFGELPSYEQKARKEAQKRAKLSYISPLPTKTPRIVPKRK